MNCTHCDDTGSTSKRLDGYLDCANCDVAVERVALQKWADAMGFGESPRSLWKIYLLGQATALVRQPVEMLELAAMSDPQRDSTN